MVQHEFDKILVERAVIPNLNALDDLIADARKRQSRSTAGSAPPIAPHTLPAQEIITAHTAPILISQNSQLNAKIQTTSSQNASLMEEIRRQREEIEALLRDLESTVGDLEGAGTLLGEEMEGQGKTEQARGVERVLLKMET